MLIFVLEVELGFAVLESEFRLREREFLIGVVVFNLGRVVGVCVSDIGDRWCVGKWVTIGFLGKKSFDL